MSDAVDEQVACSSPEDWHSYACGSLSSDAVAAMDRHAEECGICAAERSLACAFEEPPNAQEAAVVSDIAARVAGRIAEKHGANDASVKVVSMREATAPVQRGSAWLALAAGLLALLVGGLFYANRQQSLPEVRSPGSGALLRSTGSIELLEPLGEIQAPPEFLRWRDTGGSNGTYRVQIERVDGRSLLDRQVEGDEIRLDGPELSLLVPHVTYRWRVSPAGGMPSSSDSVDGSREGTFMIDGEGQ